MVKCSTECVEPVCGLTASVPPEGGFAVTVPLAPAVVDVAVTPGALGVLAVVGVVAVGGPEPPALALVVVFELWAHPAIVATMARAATLVARRTARARAGTRVGRFSIVVLLRSVGAVDEGAQCALGLVEDRLAVS